MFDSVNYFTLRSIISISSKHGNEQATYMAIYSRPAYASFDVVFESLLYYECSAKIDQSDQEGSNELRIIP